MTIKVTINSDGGYTCDPGIKDKAKGKGSITWKIQTDGYHFASPGVTWGTPDPSTGPKGSDVFGAPDIDGNKMTVTDDNGGGSTVDYPYSLTIVADPTSQASKPTTDKVHPVRHEKNDPIIRNEPT